MSFFNRLFGKKEPQRQAFDADQFLQVFQQFVNANTWDESQRIVEQNPLLLHADADDLLRKLAATQPDPQARQGVDEHRALLGRCREAGIPRAFAEKMGGGGPDMPPQLQPILQELSKPARSTDMPQRVQLCRQALALVRREENAAL